MRQEPTEAQKWARKRNYAKWRLKGVLSTLGNTIYHSDVLTVSEEFDIGLAKALLTDVIKNWDIKNKISKEKFCG